MLLLYARECDLSTPIFTYLSGICVVSSLIYPIFLKFFIFRRESLKDTACAHVFNKEPKETLRQDDRLAAGYFNACVHTDADCSHCAAADPLAPARRPTDPHPAGRSERPADRWRGASAAPSGYVPDPRPSPFTGSSRCTLWVGISSRPSPSQSRVNRPTAASDASKMAVISFTSSQLTQNRGKRCLRPPAPPRRRTESP